MKVLWNFENIFLYDKCMKTDFRVLLKKYKTDLGHFFFSGRFSSKFSHKMTDWSV